MSEYNKTIAELRKKISMQDIEINEIKNKIGNELSGLEPRIIMDTPLFEVFEKIRELKKGIPLKKNMIKEIKETDTKLEELNQKTAELKALVSEREKIFKSIYENIGNAAYTVFRQDREKLRSYEHIFTELIRQDIKCNQFNKVAVSENQEEKNIIKQFVDAAKSMYRNQKHKFLLLRYPGLYRQAGKAILITDFVEEAKDKALDNTVKSLIENEKEVKRLNSDLTELEKNKDGLRKKLVSLDAKGKPHKKIHELEAELSDIDAKIHDYCVVMGNLFLDHHLAEAVGNPRTGEYAMDISGLEQKNKEYKEEIKRYETLIEIQKVDSKIVKTTNKIEQIKNQIAKEEQEIKSLQKDLTQFEKQKKSFEKVLKTSQDQGNTNTAISDAESGKTE
ncbi:MAG: hypothetical protein JXB88_25165 [Spirochaetales bacterium]|nr:hypothetical protein [Spirochaetales bacterium]